ncbi:MAG: hypothetical protein LBU84_05965 [Prevotella sp.]|jgi:hypothetical protein|nr:hypothetical protein [Prevotella sp.]
MNKITEITRRDIIELFRGGYVLIGDEKVFYPYYGRLTELDFLKKLYPLDKIPSDDTRFENAEKDIRQHTINNQDWESDWIFTDDRFELLKGSDITLLNFLCAVFHPENRLEKGCWKEYLRKINNFIKIDGYELYESSKISGRIIYSWRQITPEESASVKFIPFSIRKKKELDAKTIIIPEISKKIGKEIFDIFKRYDEIHYRTDETNYNYNISSIEALIREDIREYYIPKAFDPTEEYSETDNLEEFIMNNYPYCVFDAIELFALYNCDNNFADEINLVLQNGGLLYKLLGGKIELEQTNLNLQLKEVIKERGLKELIEEALLLYKSNIPDKQTAVEKLWDAFERLKTYYGGSNQKKDSITRIVDEIANGNEIYIALFDEEFSKLTKLGNDYRIRHHETDKIEIIDKNYYDYFFQRCFALLNLASKYLK